MIKKIREERERSRRTTGKLKSWSLRNFEVEKSIWEGKI